MHLAALGHDVEVIAPYDPGVSEDDGTLGVRRFRYAPIGSWHVLGHARSLHGDTKLRLGALALLPFFVFRYLWVVLSAVRSTRPDLIHAHWVLPSGFVGAIAASLCRIPLVVSLHGSDVYLALKSPVLGCAARWVFQRAAVVTACSELLRQGALELGADSSKTHVVTYGVDPEQFSTAVAPMPRAGFGLGADDLVVVSLGRMVPKKGFDVLVRAMPQLAQVCPSAHLIIGGDGAQRQLLQDLATDLHVDRRLHLPGTIPWDVVPSFLAMADIFVLPSVHDAAGNVDGLPNVLLEAMAAGKAVVASDIAGVPLVIRDGVNGILCPEGDPAALASAIAKVAVDQSLRGRLEREARLSIEERHNWHSFALRLSNLLDGAL